MILAEDVAKISYKYLGTPYEVMDCQAFVERCLSDCGLKKNLKGSNAWFRAMTWTGTPEDCKKKFGKIPVGAFLFILEHDGKEPEKYRRDGIGNASHIGIYTGQRQGAIHSSQSAGKVVENRFRGKTQRGGFNQVGLWKEIAYDNTITAIMMEKREDEKKMETVIISGGNQNKPINMRAAASTGSSLIGEIPQGSTAAIVEGGGAWNQIIFGSLRGYVKSEFVHKIGEESDGAEDETVTVSRARLQNVYDELGDILGLRG